jgi:predicted small integral membrane protein
LLLPEKQLSQKIKSTEYIKSSIFSLKFKGVIMSLEWMYWTKPTAIFFISIFLMICGMLVWELVSPTVERRGFLMIPTTRGTRFFLGLLGSAYIHLAWLGLTDLALWYATIVSLVWVIVVMRWG